MLYTQIDIFAQEVSFRIPNAERYQPTLFLPSLTSIIGLIGAALGLSPDKSQSFFYENGIKVGITGSHQGFFKDLWSFHKIKNDGTMVRDVVIREWLTKFKMSLFIFATEDVLDLLRKAFLNPIYALAIGISDSQVKVLKVAPVQEVEINDLTCFENTVLRGDYSESYQLNRKPEASWHQDVNMPMCYNLPVRFIYKPNGRRDIIETAKFSFIDTLVVLTRPAKGILVDGKGIGIL